MALNDSQQARADEWNMRQAEHIGWLHSGPEEPYYRPEDYKWLVEELKAEGFSADEARKEAALWCNVEPRSG